MISNLEKKTDIPTVKAKPLATDSLKFLVERVRQRPVLRGGSPAILPAVGEEPPPRSTPGI